MTRWTPKLLRAAVVLVLCVLVAAGTAGCDRIRATLFGPGRPAGTSDQVPPTKTQETTAPSPAESTPAAATVEVPAALGLYYDDAAKLITGAGLEPVDVSVHGPIDEDAGEIGTIYRQTPAAGEKVAPGTKVELRSWWESQ